MGYDFSYSGLLVKFTIDVAVLAGIPLLVATIIAIMIAMFQAITQIQDQTLSQTVKIVVIVMMFLSLGNGLIAPLVSSTQQMFDMFYVYAKQ